MQRIDERPYINTGICSCREDELLLHFARLDLSQGRREAVKELLTQKLDWDLMLERAAWHRLSPLVSHHLTTPDLSVFVPRLVLEKMQRLNYHSLARNILLQNELSCILVALNEEEIPVIVLKGAALLGSIYHDIALRPMSDLDILVQPEHLDRAEAIALRQGYVPIIEHNAQECATANLRHLPNLIHPEKRIVLEVHKHIVDSDSPYYFDLSGFWSRACPFSVLGTPVLTLIPEDHLLHLSVNFLLDRRYNSHLALGQLCDISELICHQGNSLNWDLIEKTADDHHLGPSIYFVLYACEQLLGSQVSEDILTRLQPQEFDASLANLFLRRRVLATKLWLAHELVAHESTYTLPRAIRAALTRLLPTTSGQFLGKNGRRNFSTFLYLRQVAGKLQRLGRAMLRPSELKEDLLLDRWLHDLHSSNIQTQLNNSNPEFKTTGVQ